MALGTPVILNTVDQASGVSASTPVTLSGSVPADATLFIAWSCAGTPTFTSASDDDGHTYDSIIAHATGAAAGIATKYLSGGLASGKTVTLTLSSAIGARVVSIGYIPGHAVPDRTTSRNSTGTAWSTLAGGSEVSRWTNEVVLVVAGTTDTTGNNNLTGSTPSMTEILDYTTNRGLMVAYGNQVSVSTSMIGAGTWAASGTWAAALASFYEFGQTVGIVAHDAATQTAAFATATTQNTSHTPNYDPKGVAVVIVQDGGTEDEVSGVTYGGVAMTRRTKADAAGAVLGSVYTYFLGHAIPSGTQTVAITSTGTRAKRAVISTAIAPGDTTVEVDASGSGSTVNPSLAIAAGTVSSSAIYYALFHNNDSLPAGTPPGSATPSAAVSQAGHDFGSEIALWSRMDHAGGSTTMGWTQANTVPWVHAAVALRLLQVAQASETDTAGAITRRGTPVTIGTTGSLANVASKALTTTAAIPAGSTGFVVFAIEGGPNVLSVADNDGNTWTVDAVKADATNPNADIGIASCYLPSGLAAGKVITVTFSAAANGNHHVHGGYFSGRGAFDKTASAQGALSTAWSSGATATPSASGCVAIAGSFASQNTLNSDQSGSTPAMTELSDSNRMVTTYAVVSAAVTAAGTWASSSRSVAIVAVYRYSAITATVNRATETDTAGAITARKTLAIGRASETDTAGVVTPVQTSGEQTIPVAQATETDTAGVVTVARLIPVAQASETDTAQAITARKTLAIGRVSETDSASRLATVLRVATETDTARSLGKRIAIGQASETDTARPIVDAVPIGQASETDTARPITVIWFPLVHTALETDTAQIVRRLILEIATETDTAGAVVRLILEIAEEADTAGAILPVQYLYPDVFDAPEDETLVYSPTIIRGQLLLVDVVPALSPVVYSPTIIRGQLLLVDVVPALSPIVYSPTIIRGQQIAPGVGPTGAPVVYSPTIIRGQLLLVGTGPSGSPTVYSPSLIRGQELEVAVGPSGSPTVYSPSLAHAQTIEVGVGPTGSPTVYSPSLAGSQFLVVGDLAELDEATVFEPTLVLRVPPIIILDPESQNTRMALRVAR